MRINQVATPEYVALLRDRYTRPGWGASGKSWLDVVHEWACTTRSLTILDYGCGRGTLKTALVERGWSEKSIREFDPGIEGKDALPENADLVVATDVLEHVEPALLDGVLDHMRGLADRGMFLNIALGKSKETLADGRNAHLIVETPEWWIDRLRSRGIHAHMWERKKGLNVWVKTL